jgi:tetratricopeptide (TPR) repeat protein
MNSQGREAAQRLLAIIVIVAMLGVMGIPFSVIIFFATVTYFIWRAIQQSERQDTGRIFEFYIRANDILRDEERHWFGFEISEVIERGERVLHSMTDPPPLIYYALGALYQQVGDHEAAIEHLSFVVDNEQSDERHRFTPSPELRRYVHILRKLEREPAEAPQTMAAIRSLDRARRHRAAELLAESRERLHADKQLAQTQPAPQASLKETVPSTDAARKTAAAKRPATLVAPPPIAEVLRDVYEEEKKTA